MWSSHSLQNIVPLYLKLEFPTATHQTPHTLKQQQQPDKLFITNNTCIVYICTCGHVSVFLYDTLCDLTFNPATYSLQF